MCEFCEQYEFLKKEAKERKKKNDINTYFRVRLFEYSVKDRIQRGAISWKPMKFKYCPVCGKKM